MSRSKKLYILLGVFVVACVATLAVTQIAEHKEQIKNSGEPILELSSDSVQALSWEHKGETLAFHRDETWLYDEDEKFPVSEDKINELLEQFQPLSAAFVIEEVEDFGQYGLDNPVCTIHLTTEEQSYEIKLGDFSKMDSQRYASIGDGNVYLVQNDPLDQFDAVLSDMIRHDKMPDFDQATSIQFSGAQDYSVSYEEDSSNTYCAEDVYFTRRGGKSLPLDTDRVDSYLRKISNLNPTNYVTYNVTDEELTTYGLDTPELTVTVEYTPKDEETAEVFILHISRDPEEIKKPSDEDDGEDETVTAYLRVDQSPIIYQISSDQYQNLMAASYDDLRHLEVFAADFTDVRQIDISLEGDSYTLTSEEKGKERTWSCQGEELEIDDLKETLEALRADEFTSEKPSQKEEIGLTVHLDNEHFPTVSIRLYRYDGTHCLAVVDGESVALVNRGEVVDLIEAIHEIVLNG
ncbi:DUF4340 domain-containing protein [uncultured Oscillibacter sp.]|uniref:DUF4340 domain-containing protein n=1 Tax=uncultured Oscillibacter sp. TaxID=876091 RepID=UPI00262179CF|nr:DUF4340 domain-containing protein [uncultured Oscillibacter sp.]